MTSKHKVLLATDGFVNVVLGLVLLLFPAGLLEILGLPPTGTYFYASILGAVICGIGIALFLELLGGAGGVRGLGLGGAIAINLCGGIALLVWLLLGRFTVPLRGHVVLWFVAIIVLGIGIAELAAKSWKYSE